MRRPVFLLVVFSFSGCQAQFQGGSGSDAAADSSKLPDTAVIELDAAVPDSAHEDASQDSNLACPPVGLKDCNQQIQECVSSSEPSCFIGTVQQSVRKVITDHPTWFEWSEEHSCNMIIVDINSYMEEVVANIMIRDLCAIRDPNASGEKVAVKHDITYSEDFDIVTSAGCARYGPNIHIRTCAPSWW